MQNHDKNGDNNNEPLCVSAHVTVYRASLLFFIIDYRGDNLGSLSGLIMMTNVTIIERFFKIAITIAMMNHFALLHMGRAFVQTQNCS